MNKERPYGDMTELLIDKHIKYFSLCLNLLPSKHQDQDNNKLALIYFCLQGLELMNDLKFSDQERLQFSEFIYDNYYIGNGFRSIMNSSGAYDIPSISATFFALANLLVLKSPINEKLDRNQIMGFLRECQITSGPFKGSFTPTLRTDGEPWGETDLRICYMAVSIRRILKADELLDDSTDINTTELIEFILRALNDMGGFGNLAMSESHLGYTYCALATLKLLDFDFSKINWDNTINWILHRQINYPQVLYEGIDVNHEDFGAFNGRENKAGDCCYGWWSLGSLQILGQLTLANLPHLSQFLLMNQDHRVGGFSKHFDALPDPYHTFLSLSTLSLIKDNCDFEGNQRLSEIDPVLSISQSLSDFYKSLNWG